MANVNTLEGAADALLHVKVTDTERRIAFPITRYADIINRPRVVTNITNMYGAPFGLYNTDKEAVTRDQIRSLIGPIL